MEIPKHQQKLSTEQAAILEEVKKGTSVFFTGSAGTGKSFLLRRIIKAMKDKYGSEAVAVTASTGLAATHIGGITLNSFAGIFTSSEVAKKPANDFVNTRWVQTRALVIDEVSMVDAPLFDKVSTLGSTARNRQEPFGGIQLIVTGDFFQLPPVKHDQYAFNSKAWRKASLRSFNLKQVFRQRDPEFIAMLNDIRVGLLTDRYIQILSDECAAPVAYADAIEPTHLYPVNRQVNAENDQRLLRLELPEHHFTAHDYGSDEVLKHLLCPKFLRLRKGAQVMRVKTKTAELVNGVVGVVVGFQEDLSGPDRVLPIVEYSLMSGRKIVETVEWDKWERSDGRSTASRTQIPLCLAWALSIHKSQGQTIDRVRVDLNKIFAPGQTYVALSRATCLEQLEVLNFTPQKVSQSS
ncbi:PIF1-like helicase-domain-containing protein [Favolaschia claudopus]|uniref:ATP-dependent DNA helicase n=1 Tax=Favolaschia claudopus TaxID=2862362 RepID=A0AAV9ZLN2_9AGAR